MNPVVAKQVALDNSLVPSEKRLKNEKYNARIEFNKPQREETYQVTLDALKLSPCYPAFLITAEVPELYMHQLWNTIHKIKDTYAYRFNLDKKKFRVDTEVFHEILHIYPRLLNQDFVKPPSEEELVTFIQELGYSGKCDMLSAIYTDQMHQPWRTFVVIINRCISGKTTGLDRLRESRAQILWDRKEHMPYLRFMKVIISHFISKDKTISIRNMINLHTICDDTLLEKEPAEKPKRAKKPAKKSTNVPTTGVTIRDTPGEFVPKKKTPAKVDRGKGMDLLSNVALLEAAQLKKTLNKSKLETHKLHVSGSGDGVGSQPKVPGEQEDKTTGTDKGTSIKPRVPDVPKYISESVNESWGDSGGDEWNDNDSDEVTKDDADDVDSDVVGDNEKTDSDKDENPNLNLNDGEEEENEEDYERTPDSFEFTDDDDEHEELYKDVNVRLTDTEHEEQGKEDEEMTDVGRDDSTQQTKYKQVKDDEHVTLTIVHDTQKTEGPMQSSYVSSDFANQFLNLDNIPPTNTEVVSIMNVKVR
ncbi:hypothetical protein Tco_0583252 [Tanacetum coccineum]